MLSSWWFYLYDLSTKVSEQHRAVRPSDGGSHINNLNALQEIHEASCHNYME
jgi:hypothetical protein